MPHKDILLFSGQGATDLSLGQDFRHLPATSPVAAVFLKRCYDSFQREMMALTAQEQAVIGEEACMLLLQSPDMLADPPVVLHKNPIIQGTTLYIHQILAFIAYTGRNREDLGKYRPLEGSVAETVGFCSGIITAIITASCQSTDSCDLISYAVEGFRLIFWISLRSAICCLETPGVPHDGSRPRSLVVLGLSVEDIESRLNEFNRQHIDQVPLRISALLSRRAMSICGTGSTLFEFQSNCLRPPASSHFANVHGYYHGGLALQQTVARVLADVKNRDIGFPPWEALKIPVRSSADGSILDPKRARSPLEAALKSIFIDRVEWTWTSQSILENASNRMQGDPNWSYRIQPLGPNTGTLLWAIKDSPSHPRLGIADHLPKVQTDCPSSDDIAIVGMSINFPSGKGPVQLWNTLERGLNAVQEVPASRFDASVYYEPVTDGGPNLRKMNVRHGNFLDNPFEFDNTFFQISPREARSMDPQQRILLQAALEALEDAGYAPDSSPSFRTDGIGVFIGAATGDYADNTRNCIDVHFSPGTLRAFLSGRISYAFQWKGPSVVVDTACSSSVTALYQACRALQAGDCACALAGGVNVISSPDMYLGLSRAHFLSSTGQCKPWDVSADGYCRAEGCGLFVLKRWSDAVNEGDRVYALIRGVEINQSGGAKSITHPDSYTQASLLKQLFSRSNVCPGSIDVVEAHGTGTQAGDFAEVVGLQNVFGQSGITDKPLILSSIKGNIGHAEAASGAAGLAKLLLMIQKQWIPAQCSFTRVNPRLAPVLMAGRKLVVPTELTEWKDGVHTPRRALLTNFGAAGCNTAMIVEEYKRHPRDERTAARSCYLLNISAKSAGALEILRTQYCDMIESRGNSISLEDFCYSANARRQVFREYRLSVYGRTLDEILQQLRQTESPSIFPSKEIEKSTVFVFSGQGAVYQGMGAELLATLPIFQKCIRACDNILSHLGYPRVDAFIGGQRDTLERMNLIERRITAQTACFALEFAMAKVWISWGIVPDILIGHSLGEYAALTLSGVLSLSDAIYLVAKRAELMSTLCEEDISGLVACNLPAVRVETILAQKQPQQEGLTVACRNSPHHCTVSGPLASLDIFSDFCQSTGFTAKRLDVPYGFHSPAMDPIVEPFKRITSTIAMNLPKIPVSSSYFGRLLAPKDTESSYLADHARQPVQFVEALQAIAHEVGEKTITFLEVGPTPATLSMIKSTLEHQKTTFLASLKRSETPWATLSNTLKHLFFERYPIKWRQVYDGTSAEFLADLPRYPLSPSTFVVPFTEPSATFVSKKQVVQSACRFLKESASNTTQQGVSTFRIRMSALADFIKAHKVVGSSLCPASVYSEIALEAMKIASVDINSGFKVLDEITFREPLVYTNDGAEQKEIRVTIDVSQSRFKVESDETTLHCRGSSVRVPAEYIQKQFQRKTAYIKRQLGSVPFADLLSSRMLYQVIFPRVVSYSDPYLTVKQLKVASSGLEAHGTFQVPHYEQDDFVCPPAFLDTLLHATGFLANSRTSPDEAAICVKVERIVLPENVNSLCHENMQLYCSLIEATDNYIGDAYALNESGQVLSSVEGMHFKRLRLKPLQAHLSRISHEKRERPAEFTETIRRRSENEVVKDKMHHHATVVGITSYDRTTAQLRMEIKNTLSEKLRTLCGIEGTIDYTGKLSEVGVDSFIYMELVRDIQVHFPNLKLTRHVLEECENLEEMEQVIVSMSKPQVSIDARNSQQVFPQGLESPYEQGLNAERLSTGITSRLDSLFREVCGFSIAMVDKDTTFSALGIDSLLAIELEMTLQRSFGVSLGSVQDSILETRVRDLEQLIVDCESSSTSRSTSSSVSTEPSTLPSPNIDFLGQTETGLTPKRVELNPVQIQKGNGSGIPLYLFHDGSGLCDSYRMISCLDRPVYAIHSMDFPALDDTLGTIEELASFYIEKAGLTEATTEIIVGGWSFGGVLAFEISRQLRIRQARPVKGVVLLDSPPPVDHQPLPATVISHVCRNMSAQSVSTQALRTCLEAQFHRSANFLRDYNPQPDSDNVPCVMIKCQETFDVEGRCGVVYPWLSDSKVREEAIKLWESLIGGKRVPVIAAKGNHFSMFSPQHVDNLSTQLKRACEILEDVQEGVTGRR